MIPSSQIRQQFIDFFAKKHGHTFVPSSSVVPLDDPTLLFANAGMNQFKDVFLGTGTRPYKRAANTQKCIRAGGKHNDLDDVGKDTYHHTFFEMLGNWSFGDYFKKEAIAWAWELLTEVWQLDKTRLHVTVFEGDPDHGIPRDDEAAQHWRDVGVPEAHIHLGSKKDNFWEMGETGPCGPCTEIHIDLTPDRSGANLVNKGTPQVIEIWNLVFIQFNRNPDRSLVPLPAKHVDTGMGFERVTAVIQGKASNYDTDIFAPLFQAIHKATGARPYGGKLDDLTDTAYRVIADHIRTLTFALTDGATIGNDGRDYVLKRILRRAERYGKQYLGTTEPFLHTLVAAVVDCMGAAFPELKRDPARVRSLIYDEETTFLRTLDRGIQLFDALAARVRSAGTRTISGADAFKLHDTYGIYIDITGQMAQEAGLDVDLPGYEREMEEAKERSRKGSKKHTITAVRGELPPTDDAPKYRPEPVEARIVGWIADNTVITSGTLKAGDSVALLLDRTPFYAEQGGQVGDTGTVRAADGAEFEVEDTQRLGDAVLHFGTLLSGELKVGQAVQPAFGTFRRIDVMRNHTATHLLNLGLRQVLGTHVEQKGSLVDGDRTRFDFSHDKPLTADEMRRIEEFVNQRISRDLPVTPVTLPLAEAKTIPGVRAVFGEKYPDPVRVVMIGPESPKQAKADDSIEFCGGTHLARTGLIGYFKLVSQEGVAKGVRRLTGITGRASLAAIGQMNATLASLAEKFQCKPEELPARVDALQQQLDKLQAQLKKGAAADLTATTDKLFATAETVGAARVIVGEIPAVPLDQVRAQLDRLRQKAKSAVVLVGWVDEGKVGLMAAVTDDLTGKVEAGKLIGEVAKAVGGKGGGRKDMAQAGGPDAAKLPDALALARRLATEKIK
ncbi:MAG: alanine--tRNA ligase [Gemmataceae bacterium]